MRLLHFLGLVLATGLLYIPDSDGGWASGFFKLGKGLFNAAELTSNALEAACLGVSIAELTFGCGSIHQPTCNELQKQGKKTKELAKESDSMYGHKRVVDLMNQLNYDNLQQIERINSMVMELAKDGLRNIKNQGIAIITEKEVRDLRQQKLKPAGSDTLDTFYSVQTLQLNLTKLADTYQNRSKTEEERLAHELKFSATVFAVQMAFSLGPKLVPWLVQTYNLKNTDLLILGSEFSSADGGLTKFKQAIDRRTGKSYLLQYINISGEDVVKHAIKIDPWDNTVMDVIHNHGLSATDRAQAADYMKKHAKTGPRSLQAIFDNADFKAEIKFADNMEAVIEEYNNRRPTDPPLTQADVNNAEINQFVDRVNTEHMATQIVGDSPMNSNTVSGTKNKVSTLEAIRNWWKSKTTGDPNYGKRANVLMLEFPDLAETLKKTGMLKKVMNMIASKEDDIDLTRKFLEDVKNKVDTNKYSNLEENAKRKGIEITKSDIKKICNDERQLANWLKENPGVKEESLRKLITQYGHNPTPIHDIDNLYYDRYKEMWTKNKQVLDGNHKNLKNNMNSNDAKEYFMKALNMLPNADSVRNFITVLADDVTKVTNSEIKKILIDNGIRGVTSNEIAAFSTAYNSDPTGLFSKTNQAGSDEHFKNIMSQKLGLSRDQCEHVLRGLKNTKALTPEKMNKIANKRKFRLGSLSPQTYEKSGDMYIPLKTKFASWTQKKAYGWKTAWSGSSSMDDFKSAKNYMQNSWRGRKLSASFEVFTGAVGVASTGLSFYTCAYQQLGRLDSKEKTFTKEIEEGKIQIEEFEAQVNTLKTDIKERKKEAIESHCKLSRTFVSFMLELTGNMDKKTKACSDLTVDDPDLIGRNLTYTAISKCYGDYKNDNPYKGTECKNIEETPPLSLDYSEHQQFLNDRLMNMSTFLQEQKDIIAAELNSLVLGYNIESLANEKSPIERVVRLLKKYGFKEGKGNDFTKFSILKKISVSKPYEALYNGYPLDCFRNEQIKNNNDLNEWVNRNMNFDAKKLEDFIEAVEDNETLKYMKKKAAKGRYHFSTAGMTTEEANARVLKEIATRVLPTAAVYTDEDDNTYSLKKYRAQQNGC